MLWLPSFLSFEFDFLVIDTPKAEDLILGFDFLNHFNPYIDFRQWLITFNADYKDYYDPSKYFSNDFSSSKSCEALVGHSRTPSFTSSVHIPSINLHKSLLFCGDEVFIEIEDVGEDNSVSSLNLFFGNMDLPPSFYHDSMEELWDEEEEEGEIETMMRVVPSIYHQYLDVFSKVKAEKLCPHCACDHHIELEGYLPSRKLNAFTRKKKYPVPPINQLLTVFNGSSIFSKIDLCGAYSLPRIKEGYEHLKAFRTKYGSYEYFLMPFGLTNAPASFQNFVNDIFYDLLDIYVVVYLDDIVVFSKYEEEHVTHVSTVCSRLRANNLFAKASKCLFHVSSVESLGYIVSSEGLKMDQAKVQQILNWPPPLNVKALQSLLGFSNFYHCFIKNYSNKTSSLTSFPKKDPCFLLNEEALSQFHQLKEALTTALILSYLNPSVPTIVETNASNYALGAILSQVSDSGKHPIEFDSRKHIPLELNYDIHYKELLGIVWALKGWRAFLRFLSSPFEVLTNNSSLKYFMSSRVLTRHQTRWAEFLSEFHFSSTYHPGCLATIPDALSF
ncbi:hypothetical protein O181_022528 [Austropuccinia psidii MF-1]|uniref:RNA-directed DNA polymerase n=1 Tax=Austropuccinia psidii MF-1 TaxID=1389203 RepID=A0A9Q3GWF6_9BASI|nr:hypothetical protein [Austropuccinia psidii MF-1]